LSQLIDHQNKHSALPENALLITFDDGYSNNYHLAYPILKELDLPFVIFPVASFIGETVIYDNKYQTFLNVAQLNEMNGLAEYGFHGMQHLNLLDLDDAGKRDEIEQAVQTIKTYKLNFQAAWAYTYGNFPRKNNELIEKLRLAFIDNKVTCAFRIGNRINKLPLKAPYHIERIDIKGHKSMMSFKLKVRFGKLF